MEWLAPPPFTGIHGRPLYDDRKDRKRDKLPLLSVRDLRILMIVLLFGTPEDFVKRLEQMKIRHKNRMADIDRHYENDE